MQLTSQEVDPGQCFEADENFILNSRECRLCVAIVAVVVVVLFTSML